MRIISQIGDKDFNYDFLTIWVDNIYVKAELITDMGCGIILGEYSTHEKALKAMEMLHDKHLSRMELEGGYDMVNGCYVQPNYWVLPKIFQFPQDSEVDA